METQPHKTRTRSTGSVFAWRLIAWGALGGLILACLGLGVGLLLRPSLAGPDSTPVLTVFPGPTSTATLPDTTSTPEPSPTSSPPPSSNELFLGAFVAVSGTEGDGLRMRDGPGLEATIIRLAVENEVFQIEDGPQDVDGYVWWYVVNPYDPEITGWVVSNYLRLAEE